MKFSFLTFSFMMSCLCVAQTRQEINLCENWQFTRDGQKWQQVSVPHDWAIDGPFDKLVDIQYVAIKENGENHQTEHTGRSGSLPWIGKGEYKTNFIVSKKYKHAELVFDGAMSEPVVSVNGRYVGKWCYGYNAFRMDITPYINIGSDNELDVKLTNLEESSRWYPGAGIYRPVHLVLTGDVAVDTWGTCVRTVPVDAKYAKICVNTQLRNKNSENKQVFISLLDSKNNVLYSQKSTFDDFGMATTTFDVENPRLWSPETPNLYYIKTQVYDNGELCDQTQTKFGIRTISVSKEHGFQLNGVTRKIKGVCLHHDLGPLGAAVNKAAIIRQVKILKDMGCDAIRTSHNMPSTMQMDVCDSLGMMVMAESFDSWIDRKVKNGYNRFFKEWSDSDVTNLILNHRNHPSIVMWSMGNEINEQWKTSGVDILKHLMSLCHKLDPTRPVTMGMNQPDGAIKSGFAQTLDIPGFNYHTNRYVPDIESLPQGFILGSETASTVSSRGVYKFPVIQGYDKKYSDGQCSGYDTEYCSWSNIPEDDWVLQDDKPWVIGEFVWTGFDYLGEPTPYDSYWPSRSSYFGICDLAGLPKDRYYLYRSHWNTSENTIHLLPHWTWKDRKGEVTPVYCYTNQPTAELFVNGKSQGKISKDVNSKYDRYRLKWNNVVYEPGELKVVVYDKNGNKVGEEIEHTASKPAKLVLTSDRDTIKADGNDIAFVTIKVVDKNGEICPDADNELEFNVTGAGKYQAACNGDATSLEPFTQPQMKAFHGELVVLVRSTKIAGDIKLSIKDFKNKHLNAEVIVRSIK
jgi:beta-galactosidase